MAGIASTSRSVYRAVYTPAARLVRLQPYSTTTTTTTTTPLPGAAVLPEAFRAPAAAAPLLPGQQPVLQAGDLRRRAQHGPGHALASSRFYQPYKLHVYSTRNNTILTLSTSPSGAQQPAAGDPHVPVAWVSAGSAGYKGAARGTYDAAVEVSLKMFKKIHDLVEPPVLSGGKKLKAAGPPPTELEIVWKGFGQGRDAVFRTLMSADGDNVRHLVRRVTDAVSPCPTFLCSRAPPRGYAGSGKRTCLSLQNRQLTRWEPTDSAQDWWHAPEEATSVRPGNTSFSLDDTGVVCARSERVS